MKRIVSILGAALLAAACTAGGPAGCTTDGGPPPALVQTADEKALYIAEVGFAGALLAVERGVDSGALKGENAAKASELLADAKAALEVARAAYATGDTVQALLKAQESTDLIAQLALIEGAGGP